MCESGVGDFFDCLARNKPIGRFSVPRTSRIELYSAFGTCAKDCEGREIALWRQRELGFGFQRREMRANACRTRALLLAVTSFRLPLPVLESIASRPHGT